MTFDKYLQDDGFYRDEAGCCYEVEDWLQTKVLGFCGCGRPQDSIKYILERLVFLKTRMEQLYEKVDYKFIQEAERKLFASDGESYFFYYVMDLRGLTEHGGSVPGWLTQVGEDFILDATEYLHDFIE